jgi:hypothetical protein
LVEHLISRARRRLVLNEALGQLAFAAAVAIAGLALILLVGTRWLEWWTLSFFAAAGIAAGAWRVWQSSPDYYVTAVRLDANAGLHDALSTALYFSSATAAHEPVTQEKDLNFRRRQREQAEAIAGTVDLDIAVPFTIPRTLYLMAGLAVLASALLLVRFSAGHGLDLRPPLTEVLFEDQAARQQAKQKQSASDRARQQGLEAAESLLAKLGIPLNPDEKQPEAALAKAIDEALDGAGAAADKGKKGPGAGSEEGKAGNGLEQTPEGDPMDGKSSDGKSADGAESKTAGGDKGQQGDKGGQKNGQGGDNASLLSKLKDAVSNMMSKTSQDKAGSGQKAAQPGQQAKADKASGDKGSGKGQEQQGPQQGDAQAGDPNGDPQDGQQAEGKAGSKSAQSSAQAGSGVGSQDGAKDIRAAEQLKAMGKISEIIGKRAASVTGETTIEVQSGNQQLRTAYTNKTATHAQTDSDVSRDEIPVGLQNYVQQYFEQVRKPAPGAAKPKSK